MAIKESAGVHQRSHNRVIAELLRHLIYIDVHQLYHFSIDFAQAHCVIPRIVTITTKIGQN